MVNEHRVEQRLRSTAELAFLLHGLQFARARISLAPNSFAHTLEITVGIGPNETLLTRGTRAELAARVGELFARRRVFPAGANYLRKQNNTFRRIGPATDAAAHSRLQSKLGSNGGGTAPEPITNPAQDPLYRAAPERWLESVLRANLAPLTRSLAPTPQLCNEPLKEAFANEPDPDTRGNRAEARIVRERSPLADLGRQVAATSRVIPRIDPHHVYTQVPAIVGANDHGLLDLLGVTADGRLAVIELKADDDLHFALQGLDYWIRVRHHHLQTADPNTGLGEFQRHGYFAGVQLSPLPPRLYLVAPALHIHPATETILRYFSPRVEWNLLALDERWREQIRVVWRRSGGRG